VGGGFQASALLSQGPDAQLVISSCCKQRRLKARRSVQGKPSLHRKNDKNPEENDIIADKIEVAAENLTTLKAASN